MLGLRHTPHMSEAIVQKSPSLSASAHRVVEPSMVTSTLELAGYRVTRSLGIARGIVVRSRSVFGNIGAGFQMLLGGNISIYTQLCEKARQEAFELMLKHAAALGANAVLSMRYDANDVSPGVTEVLAYGTAVTVERIS